MAKTKKGITSEEELQKYIEGLKEVPEVMENIAEGEEKKEEYEEIIVEEGETNE